MKPSRLLDESRLRDVHAERVEPELETCGRAGIWGGGERHADMRQPHVRGRRRDAFFDEVVSAQHYSVDGFRPCSRGLAFTKPKRIKPV